MPSKKIVPKTRSYTGLIIVIIIALIAVVGAGIAVWYFLFKKKKVGDDCTTATECKTGLICTSGKCAVDTSVNCDTSADCNDSTKKCDPTTHKCVPKINNGQCSSNEDCLSGQSCQSGTCSTVHVVCPRFCPVGQVCNETTGGQCVDSVLS